MKTSALSSSRTHGCGWLGARPADITGIEIATLYLSVGRSHPRADSTARWPVKRGALTGTKVAQILKCRDRQAGLAHIRPHQFRQYTLAHPWLLAGGDPNDLMRLTGWRSVQMLACYGASAADEQASDAHRRPPPEDRLYIHA